MKKLVKIKDNKIYSIFEGSDIKYGKEKGYEEYEVEECYDGGLYLEGQAPQKTLEELKQEKIQELKANANDYILTQYPYYKQLNIIRIGTEEEKNNMSSFIDRIRNRVNQLELDINSCNTEEKLSTINYNIYDNNK